MTKRPFPWRCVIKDIAKALAFFLLTYLICGMVIGLSFWSLYLLGCIKVRGLKNLPGFWRKNGVVFVSNHPSLVEPVLLIGLLFFHYLVRPFKYGPYTVAEQANYLNKWWSLLISSRIIPVNRENPKETAKGLIVAVKKVLSSGGNLFFFPEGGRTFKGTDFHYSESGRKVREFEPGLAAIATIVQCQVVPIWFERRGFRMIIVIGEPMTFTREQRDEVIPQTRETILQLADQAS